MTCMTLFAQPMAMATTQLVKAVCQEDTCSWQMVLKTPQSLRMSWVVVTDEHGQRQIRMHWVAVEDRSENRL